MFFAVCKVVPNSKVNKIQELPLNNLPSQFSKWNPKYFLKVHLKAKPIEGKANKKLIDLLAQRFNVGSSAIEIITGQKGRLKVVRVKNS